MNAMGIIGIILAGGVAVFILMGGIYALIEEMYDRKRRMMCDIIGYAAMKYSEETRELIQNIMDDSAERMPDMVKGMYKAFESDKED